MRVVNASPLIHLARVSLLELLPGAEGAIEITVPAIVLDEEQEDGAWFIHSPFPAALDAIDNPTKWSRSCLSKDSIRNTLGSIVEHAVPSV